MESTRTYDYPVVFVRPYLLKNTYPSAGRPATGCTPSAERTLEHDCPVFHVLPPRCHRGPYYYLRRTSSNGNQSNVQKDAKPDVKCQRVAGDGNRCHHFGNCGDSKAPRICPEGTRTRDRELRESSRHVKWPSRPIERSRGCLDGVKITAIGNGNGTGAGPNAGNARRDVGVTDGFGSRSTC